MADKYKYKYHLYISTQPKNDTMMLIEADIILPEGFYIAEKCYVGFQINQDHVECRTISVSGEFWDQAEQSKSTHLLGVAYSYLGGKEQADRMLDDLLTRWRISCDWMTPHEAEERWELKDGTARASCTRGALKEYIERGLVRKSGSIWLISEQAMREVFGEPRSNQA